MPLRAVLGLRQKDLEGFIENGQVLPAVDEDAAGGLVELAPAPDVHVFGGTHHVQHVGRAGVQAQAAQHLGKAQQVGQDVAAAVDAVAVQGVEVGGHICFRFPLYAMLQWGENRTCEPESLQCLNVVNRHALTIQ